VIHDADFWEGLVIRDEARPCRSCRKPIEVHALGVADGDGDVHHVHCASRRGWVPDDAAAWTMALYRPSTEAVQ